MKKILMILAVLFILAVPNIKVLALEDSFYEGEYIPGEYIKKFRNGIGKYEQLRFFRRKSDNRAVYCIELWEAISSNKLIPGYDNDQYLHSNMDYSNWERVMLISYYGYGYQNHTDDKWYVVTQFMIWKELSLDTNLYFTDKLNGNKIEKYEAEMNEINNLIQNHSNIPSIYNQTYQVKYKEPLIIQDTNNVLEKFNITGGNEIVTKKEKNTLTIMKNTIGESQIIFSNTDNMYSSRPIVYIDENGQNLLAAGSYYPIYMVVNVNLAYKNIKVIKLDKETSNLSQGDANLIGSKIQLLDKDYQLIALKEITDDHSLVFDNVPYGTYYLKEVTPGNGYLLNKALKQIVVDDNHDTYEFENQVIKNKIEITKYLKNPLTEEIKKENNATFSIYNTKKEKVAVLTTNRLGNAQVTLPYGNYTLVQDTGVKNHKFIKDLEFSITEDNLTQHFNLYNEELTATIKIMNIDSDSNLPILESGSIFKIKNLDTNRYIKDKDGNILELVTDEIGKTSTKLSSGIYQLEQVKVVDGYYETKEVYKFEISDDIEFQKDELENNYLEINVANKKKTGKLKLEKYTEYYLNDALTKTIKEKDFKVPIYASDDIYSKDGVKLYGKDEVVGILGIDEFDLYYGSYYLVVESTSEKQEFTIDNLDTKIVKLYKQIYEYEEKEEVIEFPNTLSNKSMLSNINLLPIVLGLSLMKRKKYETK